MEHGGCGLPAQPLVSLWVRRARGSVAVDPVVLTPQDPIRETLHALTRSAVYGLFSALLLPAQDAMQLANHFEQAFNLAGTVPSRLPFDWSTSRLLGAVTLARTFDPSELLRSRRSSLDETAVDAIFALNEPSDPLAAQRLLRCYQRLDYRAAPSLPADHLAVQLDLLRELAEREADATSTEQRSKRRCEQADFIDCHLAPLADALSKRAQSHAGRNPFAAVLVAVAAWLQGDRRWLGKAIGPTTTSG